MLHFLSIYAYRSIKGGIPAVSALRDLARPIRPVQILLTFESHWRANELQHQLTRFLLLIVSEAVLQWKYIMLCIVD